MVTDSDIIENLTFAISESFGVPVSQMPKCDTTTTFAIEINSGTRVFKVSDEFIAISANRRRRITANDYDLKPALEAVANCAANDCVVLYGDGRFEITK